jgi:hypothetical protein
MYIQTRTQREEYQRIIVRKTQEVRKWVSEKLDGTELYNAEPTHDGIGLRIAIKSIRAKQLLLDLHKDVFYPGFEEPKLSLDEQGVWTAWFGYSEPVVSPHYVVSVG